MNSFVQIPLSINGNIIDWAIHPAPIQPRMSFGERISIVQSANYYNSMSRKL